MSVVEVKKENQIAYVTMNRAEKRNALSVELAEELIKIFQELDEDKGVRVVIYSGAGKGFSAGGDLETLNSLSGSASIIAYMKTALEVVRTIRKMNTHVVAAVQGFAAGAGFSLALACDYIVAEKGANLLVVSQILGLFQT